MNEKCKAVKWERGNFFIAYVSMKLHPTPGRHPKLSGEQVAEIQEHFGTKDKLSPIMLGVVMANVTKNIGVPINRLEAYQEAQKQ